MELATASAAVASAARSPNRFSSPRAVSISWNNSSFASSSNSRSLSTSSASTSRRRLPVASAAVELREAASGDGDSVRVTETLQPGSSVEFSVEVPTSIIQECYQSTLQEYAKRFKVPGFRPGKIVPENILINYVGPEHVQDATLEAILKRTLPQALSSVEERALEDSVRILTKFDDMRNSFSLDDVFRYDVSVDVAPEVRWLSEDKYKNLKVVVEIDDVVNAEKAAEKELKRRHKALGLLRIVADRGLQVGDLVVLDIFAESINSDGSKGEKISSAESTGFHLDTEENNNLVPGFLGSLIGICPGETRSFPIQFPESFEQESLRGVRAQFTVVCKELFYRELPEMDDSLAGKLLPGCTTMDEVRERILERCKEVEKTAIEQATDNAILDQLGKLVEVDVPRSLFQEQGQQLYGAKLLQLQAERKLDKDQLASLSSQRSVQEYLEDERENITRIIKQMLAVGEIFKSENLQYSTDQLVKEIENSVAEFKQYNQDYDEDNIKQQVQDVLEASKVLEWLKENCTIEYIRQ
ncbi:trigger factor-like protein TIG, Chloroplastic [Phragmites australis]|uniref:trigger factor-like protein TIG, Chloroplastic n=1 Tax=Phragmites australis TaxID=29695 RepID=UPI002D79E872|nr:trigger factor-like protein TIG, Chloroplastic [Phragmites australis]